MSADKPLTVSDVNACVDAVIGKVGRNITLGLPLGLGKPVRFVNALYQRAKDDPTLNLHIVTALSLLAPQGGSSLEKRFMGPFTERLYGRIPELAYARDVVNGQLPDNVRVSEFFFKAGTFLRHEEQQRNYVCTNYTHAVRDLMALGVNVIGQLVSASPEHAPGHVSLSCNPDLSLDLFPLLRERERGGTAVALVGEKNSNLPYFGHKSALPLTEFDVVLEHRASDYPLFSAPQMAISPEDHLIGFYASALLKDGGTLQVGIGSLGAALVYSTIMRHTNNKVWRELFSRLRVGDRFPLTLTEGGSAPFAKGLYGCSEMMVDGFIHLLEAGVLKREVFDHAGLQQLINKGHISDEVSLRTLDVLRRVKLVDSPLRARDVQWLQQYGILKPDVVFRGGRLVVGEQSLVPDLDDAAAREALAQLALGDRLTGGVLMHGGFYVGPEDFYEKLRGLSPQLRDKISMTSVNYINHLYDHRFGNQRLKVAQRSHGRFINSTMMYTLSGAAVSDGLEDGRVVSGVGGQYNFVAMAHELPGARSILTMRATRQAGGKTLSNIVFSYGHCTIPRHLRDIVVTEYGIADLRGRSDEDVYLELIRIADSRFQPDLLRQAQKAGKVPADFQLPVDWTGNTPEAVREALAGCGDASLFPAFPFGCDFTEEELILGKALKALKAATATPRGKLTTILQALRARDEEGYLESMLERMALHNPSDPKARLERRLVIHGLQMTANSPATGKSKN